MKLQVTVGLTVAQPVGCVTMSDNQTVASVLGGRQEQPYDTASREEIGGWTLAT